MDNQRSVGHDEKGQQRQGAEIIFIGTGTSEGIPIVSCLTKGFEEEGPEAGDSAVASKGREESQSARCKICFDAVRTDIRSPNHRRNTSLLVRCPRKLPSPDAHAGRCEGSVDASHPPTTRTHDNILIDCGKFFWASALEWFPHHKLRYIDALVLTHRHNDACYGVDDLRDWTRIKGTEKLNVYLRDEDLKYMAQPFQYLVDSSTATAGGGVAQLQWNEIQPYQPFNIGMLTITPLELVHGNTPMFGFMFGDVVYLSDVNKIPDRTRDMIKGCRLLIIDMLRLKDPHPSHFILDETLAEIRLIKPKQALLVGMNHMVDHDSTNAMLRQLTADDGIDVQLAYDGQRLPISLAAQN